jgi:hypothetical protein
MADSQGTDRRDSTAAEPKLFTLSEVALKTNISMPTLQRYKKTYQDRIPSVGSGRKQRYPEHALPVFEELRSENASKRGRPRKNAAAGGSGAAGSNAAAAATKRKGSLRTTRRGAAAAKGTAARGTRQAAASTASNRPAARRGVGRPAGRRNAAAAGKRPVGRPAGRGRAAGTSRAGGSGKTGGLLTLTQISKTTGVSYPTLVRYVRLYSDRLPHEGEGRSRRFYPEAVAVFRSLREESSRGGRRAGKAKAPGTARRGRPPKATTTVGRLESILAARIRDLEKFQHAIEKRFGDLVKGLQKLR